MAITRAQQAKQMLQNGGMLVQPGFGGTRQGYRGPGGYQGRTPSTKASNPNQRTGASEDGVERDTGLERERQRNIAKIEKFKATRPEVKKIPPMGPIGIATITTTELLTHPLVMEESEILKVQASDANELHVIASILEIQPREVT